MPLPIGLNIKYYKPIEKLYSKYVDNISDEYKRYTHKSTTLKNFTKPKSKTKKNKL